MARIQNEVRDAVLAKMAPVKKAIEALPAKKAKVEKVTNKKKKQ